MPRLEKLASQVAAFNRGEPLPGAAPVEPTPDPMTELVDAIRSIELHVEQGESRDYSSAFTTLGEALVKAMKAHGSAVTKALSAASQTVNVEAPVVNLEAEINVPERKDTGLRVVVTGRDRNGELSSLEFHPIPVKGAPKKESKISIE